MGLGSDSGTTGNDSPGRAEECSSADGRDGVRLSLAGAKDPSCADETSDGLRYAVLPRDHGDADVVLRAAERRLLCHEAQDPQVEIVLRLAGDGLRLRFAIRAGQVVLADDA